MSDIPQTLLELAQQLTQAGKAFVSATVVWCERPTSAKPGAKAIIEADGHMTGWIGGSCAQPVVVREAQRALREGDAPYLLRLGSSEMGHDRRDVRTFPMTCASGGALDIYMEPHLPAPHLVVFGDSPIVTALKQFAPALNFVVTHLEEADISGITLDARTYVLVATHGHYDEDVLELVLRGQAAYVGMVCSRRRADACRAYLRASGLTEEQIACLKAPAGLDLGAVTPEEIAVSILAELVQVQRHAKEVVHVMPVTLPQAAEKIASSATSVLSIEEEKSALDPVCGMMVEVSTARHRSVYDGRTFYFCCPACKRVFEGNPQEYLVQNER